MRARVIKAARFFIPRRLLTLILGKTFAFRSQWRIQTAGLGDGHRRVAVPSWFNYDPTNIRDLFTSDFLSDHPEDLAILASNSDAWLLRRRVRARASRPRVTTRTSAHAGVCSGVRWCVAGCRCNGKTHTMIFPWTRPVCARPRRLRQRSHRCTCCRSYARVLRVSCAEID